MNLSIIYRAYPAISKKTAIKFESKNDLMKFCITSLKNALVDVNFEFIFISDNCSQEQINTVNEIIYKLASDYSFIELSGVGNQLSFEIQINKAKECKYENILILEDDYYIDKYDIKENIIAIENETCQYSTFYYSPDADRSIGGMEKGIRLDNHGVAYTELPSTTLTFMTKKNILIEDSKYFMEYVNGAHDSSIWLKLTNNYFWFLTRIIKPMFFKNLKLYFSIIKRYILFLSTYKSPKRKLFFIGYGRSTHLDSNGIYYKFFLLNLLKKIQ